MLSVARLKFRLIHAVDKLPSDSAVPQFGWLSPVSLCRQPLTRETRSVVAIFIKPANGLMRKSCEQCTYAYVDTSWFAAHRPEVFQQPHLPFDLPIRDHVGCDNIVGLACVCVPWSALESEGTSDTHHLTYPDYGLLSAAR